MTQNIQPTDRPSTATSQRIVAAATTLFLRDGYAKTSLDVVADVAETTKPTIYNHFKSKRGVLLAVTQQLREESDQITVPLHSTGDVSTDLRRFGRSFVKHILASDVMAWHRLALTEASEHPEVGQSVFESGPARVLAAVTDFVAAETKAGRLTCDDPALAAEQFLGLLHGLHPIRMMTGQPKTSVAKLQRAADAAVDVFIRFFGSKST